uniref:Uncharacterized protein n=1 Tax=Pyramimonas obovata TaxID=1411642 RepID=A0A7S0RHN8_9CHLO|mmetsp:Transcript_34411/g.75257  ORF Transcript_34411/g.75257 Transcript_34411/m.75257 type:complete len:206 (+) Transcript_34411:226-843(+)|eukprot:CAMPEP_0118924090 /NCGR_PEP_ID=MMETSP1169-20130426/2383_1 /TAXON_ID=36882 /ORGANISM="Pyramimonas obovata, Strain CCMP722" /LENGTH=205 /DNA_ID=CAMNT_0006865173 /DNA_START=208 /DNA_END=825 /DNA_ORIENTATION=+
MTVSDVHDDHVKGKVKQPLAHGGLDVIDNWDRGNLVSSESLESTSDPILFDYPEVSKEDGLIKGILGRTWPGIEYGEPPRPKYSFFQYIDAARLGNRQSFETIQEADRDWWFPNLDRGAGAALHFAVDHGQLEFVKYLVEECGAAVNQQDRELGFTPLHRCARLAHVTSRQYMEIFEYLLQAGADSTILTYDGQDRNDIAASGRL